MTFSKKRKGQELPQPGGFANGKSVTMVEAASRCLKTVGYKTTADLALSPGQLPTFNGCEFAFRESKPTVNINAVPAARHRSVAEEVLPVIWPRGMGNVRRSTFNGV